MKRIFLDICASVHDGQDGGEDDSNLLLVDRLNILNIIIIIIVITDIIITIIRSLVSAHCSPNPTYAVFTKQHSSMPLAMKVAFLLALLWEQCSRCPSVLRYIDDVSIHPSHQIGLSVLNSSI